MFHNYGYFARNVRYVINIMHYNLHYGASRLFINPSPKFAWSRAKKNLSATSSPSLQPRRQRREKKEKRKKNKTYFWWFSVVVLIGVVSKHM